MRVTKAINTLFVLGAVLAVIVWLTTPPVSQAVGRSPFIDDKPSATDYVGSDTCQACHEDQFKAYSHTAHAALATVKSWKNKVTGCESCHGPGKAHVDGGGDKTKIVTFANKTSKEVSETCLSCHAGKEERNNFRRGEHWRNDIGCTDCHSPHTNKIGENVASSNYLVTTANAEKPGFSTIRMLKANDPQLCTACHAEVKPQFSAPFHHKVLEVRCVAAIATIRTADLNRSNRGWPLVLTQPASSAMPTSRAFHLRTRSG